MSRRKFKTSGLPDTAVLERAVKREKERRRTAEAFRSTVFNLITVSAAAVLVATFWLSVLQISGTSMNPTLHDGDLIVAVKNEDLKPGDMIAFYYNNNILVKRIIAGPGDWVDISADGVVSVNNVVLDEPYVTEPALGDCNIMLPYQVPESRYFVMGDHRSVSVDSRNTSVGCVSREQVVGKLRLRIWPIKIFGILNVGREPGEAQ